MHNFKSNSNFFYGDGRNEVITWDDKQLDLIPQVKILNLGNEFNYSLRLDEAKTYGEKRTFNRFDARQNSRDKSFLENDNCINEVWNIDTGFEWFIHIKKQPIDRRLYFTLNTKGVDFLYQGELTAEEIKEGCVRPDEIVGSFALYCPKANYKIGYKNYMSGKVGHIPAPYFIDVDGSKIKGAMYFEKDWLVIDIPEKLWNWDYSKAALILDPTFGYTTEGGTAATSNALGIIGTFNLSEAGTVTQMSFYSQSNGANYVSTSIWTLSGTTATLVAEDDGQATLSGGIKWYNLTFNDAIAAADYYLGSWGDGSYYYAYDTDAAIKRYFTSGSTYRTYPSTFTVGTSTTRKVSIYATYTAGGATSQYTHINGIATANYTHVNGIAKADFTEVNGLDK